MPLGRHLCVRHFIARRILVRHPIVRRILARRILVRHLIVVWAVVLLLACASNRISPHPDLASTWRDYLALPDQRALAIAGDPDRDRWVAGASGGHATREQAEDAALRECHRLRGMRRLQPACVLYAVGDEIVWQGR